ncbi:fatty acid hydroxylase domain-containing protein 2-like [Cochliomyia hominivorax]
MDSVKAITNKYYYLGKIIQDKWNDLLNLTGDDPQNVWVFGTTIVFIVVYWLNASWYTFMDLTNKPKFLTKYKIQSGKNEPFDLNKLKPVILNVLINHTIVTIPVNFVLYHLLFKSRCNSPLHELPSFPKIILDIIIFSLFEEFYFYYVHRLMHHKSIYKYVHKKHHEWSSPIAIITNYCHPLEHIILNLLPGSLSFAFMRSHIFTVYLIIVLGLSSSIANHCGYSFPNLGSAVSFHDYHHEEPRSNYGMLGWLDKLHGTYKESKTIKE